MERLWQPASDAHLRNLLGSESFGFKAAAAYPRNASYGPKGVTVFN